MPVRAPRGNIKVVANIKSLAYIVEPEFYCLVSKWKWRKAVLIEAIAIPTANIAFQKAVEKIKN